MLGVTGRGALTRAGRALLESRRRRGGAGPATRRQRAITARRSPQALAPALPEPIEHVLIQADLTAVAPGPLRPPVARELALRRRRRIGRGRDGLPLLRVEPAARVRRRTHRRRPAPADRPAGPRAGSAGADLLDRRHRPPPRTAAGRRGRPATCARTTPALLAEVVAEPPHRIRRRWCSSRRRWR